MHVSKFVGHGPPVVDGCVLAVGLVCRGGPPIARGKSIFTYVCCYVVSRKVSSNCNYCPPWGSLHKIRLLESSSNRRNWCATIDGISLWCIRFHCQTTFVFCVGVEGPQSKEKRKKWSEQWNCFLTFSLKPKNEAKKQSCDDTTV